MTYVQDAEKYKLSCSSDFHYLNQSRTYDLDGVSNAEEYVKTRRAMDIVGISLEDQVQELFFQEDNLFQLHFPSP